MSGPATAAAKPGKKEHGICHGWADHHRLGRAFVSFFMWSAALLLLLAFGRGCSGGSDNSRAAETPRGASAQGKVPASAPKSVLDGILSPGILVNRLHPGELLKEHYLFIGGKAMEDSAGNALKEVAVPVTREGLLVRMVGRKWKISQVRRVAGGWLGLSDAWEMRVVGESRWRDSRVDADWESGITFSEFRLRLVAGYEPGDQEYFIIKVE